MKPSVVCIAMCWCLSGPVERGKCKLIAKVNNLCWTQWAEWAEQPGWQGGADDSLDLVNYADTRPSMDTPDIVSTYYSTLVFSTSTRLGLTILSSTVYKFITMQIDDEKCQHILDEPNSYSVNKALWRRVSN